MFETGSRLGAYRIVRPLGQGGMGCVYEAEHVELRVKRALKVFETESEQGELLRKRFVAEGRILADLCHPRIVRVYDFAVDPATGAPYFAMDLVVSPAGGSQTLEDAARVGADEDRIAGWFRDICEGLAYIHSKGVVHRDISLDNILIGPDGRAVITDFGIAKITGDAYRRKIDVTKTVPLGDGSRMSWGKGLYMSPELARGDAATPASDAYALGVLFFRLLAGSWYTCAVRLEDALAGMDYNWHEVLARLCAIDAADRLGPDGIAGVAALLRKTAAPQGAGGRPWRRRAIVLLTATVVAVVCALVFVLTFGSESQSLHAPWTRLSQTRRTRTDSSALTRLGQSRPQVLQLPLGEATSSSLVTRTTRPSPSPIYHIVDVTNQVYHVVDVTNRVRETVYQIVPVTNHVTTKKQ